MTMLADLDLDPGIRLWLSRVEQATKDLPDLSSPDLGLQREAGRRLSDLIAADCTLPIPGGVDIDNVVGSGTESGVRMRRYRPSATAGPLPTQLWLHGGGFVSGSADELVNERLCARRALETGIQVFSLDYRLAPEHPYPAPVLDAVTALGLLAAAAEQFDVDRSRLGIGGTSAGAAIAASTALSLRGTGSPRLVHLALEAPVAALSPVGRSAAAYATGFGLDQIERVTAMYVGTDTPSDAHVFPLDVIDLTGTPRTLVMVAEHDPLRDSGIRLADRLSTAGVPVDLVIGAGHLHGSTAQTAVSAAARAWEVAYAHHLRVAYARPRRQRDTALRR